MANDSVLEKKSDGTTVPSPPINYLYITIHGTHRRY